MTATFTLVKYEKYCMDIATATELKMAAETKRKAVIFFLCFLKLPIFYKCILGRQTSI